jgi:hypothetical protein
LALGDASTGAFFATVCSDAAAAAGELGRFSPSEVLRFGSSAHEDVIEDALFHRLS